MWDNKRKAFYVHLTETNKRIEGIDNILTEYGEQGWELVSFSPDSYTGSMQLTGLMSRPMEMEAISYSAVFKRPKS